MKKKTIAVSLGDINGIGIQLALENHNKISKLCNIVYCINDKLLKQASRLLNIKIPKNFRTTNIKGKVNIKAGKISKKAGIFSYNSFLNAIKLAESKNVDAICTLPINKESWGKAGINYRGHTHMLSDYFHKNAIMILGCEKMFVALYTEHIPFKNVSKLITKNLIYSFLVSLNDNLNIKNEKIAVLGLNPHAGDNGVLGYEEKNINKAIKKANKKLNKNIFEGALVPDVAFKKSNRKKYKKFVCMYHDQGLIPLKALYFEESINITLNLPILRTSVDHGTAFDIAYKSNNKLSNKSYINAIKYAIKNCNSRY